MSRIKIKRIAIVSFSLIILLILGIELVSNNVIQIMAIEETEQEVKEMSAKAADIDGTLQTPSKGGYGADGTITGGSMGGASTAAQYLYAPRNILWWSYFDYCKKKNI